MEHRQAGCTVNGPPGLRASGPLGLWGFGIAAAAVMLGASIAPAQSSVYYGTIDAADKAQLAQWATHYWARVDAGTLVTPGTFTFTKAAMNDPLFLPVRGARRTLETLGVMGAQACDGLIEIQPGLGDVAVSAALREAMTQWKFRTDAVSNPAGTQAHFNLINAAPNTSNTVWGMEGSHLVSTNLPWEALTGANAAGQVAATVAAATLQTIGKLTDTAPAIAKAAAGITQTQALITGQKSHADRFEEGVVQFLFDQGSTATAWRVDASFGVFGSLPLVGVTFDDAFVLLDATDGRLDGPFALTSPLDATVLLANQSGYVAGTTVRFHIVGGCGAVAAPSWRTTPPPGSGPRWPGATPPFWIFPPTENVPFQMQPSRPSWWSNYDCAVSNGFCVCTAYGQFTMPGRLIWVRNKCVTPGAGGCPPPTAPADFNPLSPPGSSTCLPTETYFW